MMSRIMSRYIQMGAILLILGICEGYDVSARPKQMHLTYANPPIWHLSYMDRLLLTPGTLDKLRVKDKTDIVDTTFSNTARFPWKQLPRDTIILHMLCSNGYNDPELMQQIETGYVGRHYRMIEYLNITDCFLHNLTSLTFRGLSMLSSLIIRSKYIKYLPLDVFSELTNLIFMKMELCSLVTISCDMFCHNPKITFVNFAYNNLRGITSGELTNETCNTGTINSLVLNGNKIENLNNVNIKGFDLDGVLTFSNCSIYELSNVTFHGLSNVRTLDLSYNKLEHIPDYCFLTLNETLQYINIKSNNLYRINATALFDGLVSVRTIVLHTNRIEMVSGSFSRLKKLDRLQLENNRLTEVPKATFGGLSNLDRLTLGNNYIQSIEEGVFDEYKNLQILELDDNRIKELPKDFFKSTSSLSELDLSNNHILNLDETIFEKCTQLSKVYMAFNQISNLTRLSFSSERIRYIDMSNNALSVLPSLTKPKSTDCYNFPSLRVVKFSYNSIKSINATCFQTLKLLDVRNNEITNMDGFGIMSKITILGMRHNQISTIPKIEMSKLCNTIVELDLGLNLIQTIAKGTFSNCKLLEVLKLDNNAISNFEPIEFSAFRDLRLSSNPIACDCQNEHFLDWLKYHMNVAVDDITCANGEALEEVYISDCSTTDWLKNHAKEIGIPPAVVIVLFLVLSAVVFRYRYEIQIIAFYKWNIRLKCCCKKNPGMNENITYDAFVCFAEEDIDYVTDKLIPFLEPKYRLCVYYRDFPLGEDIAEAILNVINQSAIIIILLSPDFLKSRWGTFEFRKAHHAAITNEDKRMIIILLDDSVLNANLDLTLRSILYTKAYLKKGDKLFAQKLLHAMPVEPVSAMMKKKENEENAMFVDEPRALRDIGVGCVCGADDDMEDPYDFIM